MPYFLDGNNLIGRELRTPRPTAEDRALLIREVAQRLRRTRARAVLFFDGPRTGAASGLGSLSIRESGALSADDAILGEVRRSRAPGEIIVVTADRGLCDRARDAGAKSLSPDEFWKRFGKGSGDGGADSPARVDVSDWMEWFGDERNRGK